MFRKTALLLFTAAAMGALDGPAWAGGERGTRAEADAYAVRETESPALQEWSGGIGALLQAIVAFFSNAVQAIIDLFSGDDPDVFTPPPRDQGRSLPAAVPSPA
jgi:hypothetical protein